MFWEDARRAEVFGGGPEKRLLGLKNPGIVRLLDNRSRHEQQIASAASLAAAGASDSVRHWIQAKQANQRRAVVIDGVLLECVRT